MHIVSVTGGHSPSLSAYFAVLTSNSLGAIKYEVNIAQ